MTDKKFNLTLLLIGLSLASVGAVGALLRIITGFDTAFAIPTVMMVVGLVSGFMAMVLALVFMVTVFVEGRIAQKNRAEREQASRQMQVLLTWPVR